MIDFIRFRQLFLVACLSLGSAFSPGNAWATKENPASPIFVPLDLDCFNIEAIAEDQCLFDVEYFISDSASVRFLETGTIYSLRLFYDAAPVATFAWRFNSDARAVGVNDVDRDDVKIRNAADVLYLVPLILQSQLDGDPEAAADLDNEVFSELGPNQFAFSGDSRGYVYQVTIDDAELAESILVDDDGRHAHTRKLVGEFATRDTLSAMLLGHGIFLSSFVGGGCLFCRWKPKQARGLVTSVAAAASAPVVTIRYITNTLSDFLVESTWKGMSLVASFDAQPTNGNAEFSFYYKLKHVATRIAADSDRTSGGTRGVSFDWPPITGGDDLTSEEKINLYVQTFVNTINNNVDVDAPDLPPEPEIAEWLKSVLGAAQDLWNALPHRDDF